ncbi:ATP-binding protein [candidate division KSB1 bacterium]|nr:ATP-binding protein [candidate division KSB1 bacterium]
MLTNPFTPSEIAVRPNDFFGRGEELHLIAHALTKGSVAIQGPMGMGKSSLLSKARLLMEDKPQAAQSVIAVGDKEVKTIEEAARLLLQSFVQMNEAGNTLTVHLRTSCTIAAAEICGYLKAGHDLAALKKIIETETLKKILADRQLLILAIDEADKCPIPLARLIRSLTMHAQQNGVKNVRFLLAGVSPFLQAMLKEDAGVNRFFAKTITLSPMPLEEAALLIETKLAQVVREAEHNGLRLQVLPSVIARVAALSGGHPHLLQLLGTYLVANEEGNPDGVINSRDLIDALRKICYEDRGFVYDATLRQLEIYGMLEALKNLFGIASPEFPTRMARRAAHKVAEEEAIAWLIAEHILSVVSHEEYGLMDEFLRIRMLMDETERESEIFNLEKRLIHRGAIGEERLADEGEASEDVYARGDLLSIEGNELDFIDPSNDS